MSRPYISIDIETTGIDDVSQILQISAVFDDLVTPVGQLLTLDLPIKHEVMTHCEPYAIGMNAGLFQKMMNKDFKTYSPNVAVNELITFMKRTIELSGTDEKGKQRRIVFAGKNVASFDIPKIRAFIRSVSGNLAATEFDTLVHYKTLDVGSLYYDVFKDNVSLSEINKLTGRASVSHNALEDALDVVYAVRHKLGAK